MLCGHTYHDVCLSRCAEVKDVGIRDVKCPDCKRSANDPFLVLTDGEGNDDEADYGDAIESARSDVSS